MQNITLTRKEIDDILACWNMDNRQNLLFLYGLVLRTMDMDQIKLADVYLLKSQKEEENIRKDR